MTCFFLWSNVQPSSAQSPELPNVISSSSPTAAGLSRYIDFPVSLSNGIPDISIPLYTLTSSRLQVPVSLSYHSGGIKVVDRTTTMGLGWTLSAGGVVNRVVHGFPDDLSTTGDVANGGWLHTVWPAEVPSSATTLSYNDEICVANHLSNSYVDDPLTNRYYYMWDGEPDIYYFSAPNLSGKFLYRNSPDANGQRAVVIPYQPIKVSNPGSGGTAAYTMTGTDGVIYEFGGNSAISGVASDYQISDRTTTSPYDGGSAWYLTRMISADHSDTVIFKYNSGVYFEKTTPPKKNIRAHYEDYIAIAANHPPSNPAGVGDPATVTISNSVTSIEASVLLKEISCRNTDIIFNYTDLGDFMPLQSIDIYSILDGVKQKIKTFVFTISQFSGGGANALRLDDVTEMGYQNGVAVANPPYQVSYTSGDAPPYDSKAQDIWGYYNGQTSNTDLTLVKAGETGVPIQFAPEKRTPDSASMMKGMIKSITYPTGGKTEFTFQPNQIVTNKTISIPITSTATAGNVTTMHMIPGSSTEGIDITFTVPSPPSGFTVSSYTFTFSGEVNYSCSSDCINNKPQAILIDVTDSRLIDNPILTQLQSGTQTSEIYTRFNVNYIYSGHTYRLYLVDQGVLSSWDQSTHFRLSASLIQNLDGGSQIQTVTENTYAGGLRIKKIAHTDPVTGHTLLKTYNYIQPYFTCPSLFQGEYYTLLSNYFVQAKVSISADGEPPVEDPGPGYSPATYTSNIYYLESSPVPVGGTGGSSIAYQQVEEMETNAADGTTLGKTVYTYNTATDYIPNQMPSIRIDNEDIRKQLLGTKVYKSVDGGLVLVKETQNTYDNVNNPHPTSAGTDNIKFFVARSDFDFANRPSNPPAYGGWSATGCPVYDKTLPFSLQLLYYNVSRNFLSSTTVTDYDGATPLTTITNYTYDNYVHMQPTQITTTDSKAQLRTQIIKYPLDFSNITATGNDAAGIKNLQDIHVIAAPVEKSSYLKNSGNVQTLISSVFTTYHPTLPLPTQVSVVEPVSPLTDFAPAAIVTGDISKDLRYQPRLNFVYNSSGNVVEQQKVNDVKEVYLWGYEGQYPVAKILNSTYSIASTYITQSVLDNPSDDATLRSHLANLRNIPGTMVTTYTYKPLVGMTSQTDPAGRTIYYEYDSFNRLKTIRDQDGKVIKTIDYQYQQTNNQ